MCQSVACSSPADRAARVDAACASTTKNAFSSVNDRTGAGGRASGTGSVMVGGRASSPQTSSILGTRASLVRDGRESEDGRLSCVIVPVGLASLLVHAHHRHQPLRMFHFAHDVPAPPPPPPPPPQSFLTPSPLISTESSGGKVVHRTCRTYNPPPQQQPPPPPQQQQSRARLRQQTVRGTVGSVGAEPQDSRPPGAPSLCATCEALPVVRIPNEECSDNCTSNPGGVLEGKETRAEAAWQSGDEASNRQVRFFVHVRRIWCRCENCACLSLVLELCKCCNLSGCDDAICVCGSGVYKDQPLKLYQQAIVRVSRFARFWLYIMTCCFLCHTKLQYTSGRITRKRDRTRA